jgi:hypothetical protein
MAPSVGGFHPENIPSIVTSLRNDGTAASFCLGTADRPLSGKECVIYAVQFPDGATWAVRVKGRGEEERGEQRAKRGEVEQVGREGKKGERGQVLYNSKNSTKTFNSASLSSGSMKNTAKCDKEIRIA